MTQLPLLLMLLPVAVLCAPAPEAQTEYGRVRGIEERNPDVSAFYGIPFASPPVGALRWKSPQPPTPWTDTRNCTKDSYANICPQFHEKNSTILGSEDCLYMNVFVPSGATPGEKLPVLFWIYGGGFSVGDGYEFGWYRGKYLAAKRNVIVIEFNYRLGSLGFLAHPTLMAESADKSTGNYAMQDQQAALAFAYRNVENFGGDKTKITIFGESAGGMSVCWHLVSPTSKPYFVSAIMESGSCEAPEFFVSLNRAYTFSNQVLAYAGCNGSGQAAIDCARSKHFYDLFLPYEHGWPMDVDHPPMAPVFPYGPTIDGSASGLVARPIELIRAGNFAKVPLIIGTNKDEGTLFIPAMPIVVPGAGFPIEEAGLKKVLQHFFNDTTVETVLAAYPLSDYKSQDARSAAIIRDYFFACSTRETARAYSDFGIPVYLYQFTQPLPNWIDYELLGNYHSLELSFVFDHQYPDVIHTFSKTEQELSDTFTLYWSNLARYGNPNGALGPSDITWPLYNTTTDVNIFMTVPATTGSGLFKKQCDLWTQLYAKYYFDD